MDIKFNWRRIPIRRGGRRAHEYEGPTLIFHSTQLTFNEEASAEILAELGLTHGEKAHCVIDADDDLHALGFVFIKSGLSRTLSFSPTDEKSKKYRIPAKTIYKNSKCWERIQSLNRNHFSLMKTESQDPEFEGSTVFVVILQ